MCLVEQVVVEVNRITLYPDRDVLSLAHEPLWTEYDPNVDVEACPHTLGMAPLYGLARRLAIRVEER